MNRPGTSLHPCHCHRFSRALTRAVMEGCTRRLLAALGEAVRSGRQVAVDMGVGTLTGRDRALGFEFMPSYLAAHRTLAGSTRLGAWAGAAVGARRTCQQQSQQQQQVQAQVPQTRREQVLTGLAQLQAELAAGDDGSEEDSGGGVGGRDQALPGAQVQHGELMPGEETHGRQQQPGLRRTVSQPRRPRSQGPEAEDRQDAKHAPASQARRDISPGPQGRPSWGRRAPPASTKSPGRLGAVPSRPSSPGPSGPSRPLSSGTRSRGPAEVGSHGAARSVGPSRCASPAPERRGASAAVSAQAQTQARGHRPSSPGPGPRPNALGNVSRFGGLSVGCGSRGSRTGEGWSRGELSDSGDIGGRSFSPTPAERAAAEAVPTASHIQLAARAPRSRPVSPSPPVRRPASAPRPRAAPAASRAAAATSTRTARAAAPCRNDRNTGRTQATRTASAPRTRSASAGVQITGGTMASGGPSRPTSPGPTRAQPSMSAARAQALAVLRGRNASPRRAEAAPHNATGLAAAGVMGAQSQPQKQLVAQLWSPDNSLKGAVGRQETGAAAPGQRRNTATGTPVGKDAAADNAPWLRPRSQAPQQGAAEPAAARAVVADSGRQNPTQRVSYDGGKAGTSGDLDMEDQQAPRSARKPLFSSPPAGKFPVRAAQGDAKSLRRLELPHARTEKCTGVEADSARADDRTLSRSGQERLRDQSGALDRSRSPSPGPRPGAHGVVVTYAAVRSASPGPNLRYGDASTTADVTGVPAAAFARPLGSASERAAYEVAGGQAALERLVGGSKAAAEDRPLCLAKAAAAGPTSPPRRHVYALQQQQQAQQPSQSCRTQPSGPNAAATVGMAASVGSIDSLQRPASVLGRRAGGDPCVVESWEAELEAEFEDVEDLLEGVEQCLGFSADLPDTFEQDADEHTTRHGWEEPAGARHPCQAGGHSSAGGCAEEWSSSGMACSSSATSCFSFGRGGVGQVSNSSSLRGGRGVGMHGAAVGQAGAAHALASTAHKGSLCACQEEEEEGMPAGDCDSPQMPPQRCASPRQRRLRSSGSEGEVGVAPAAAQGWRSPGGRYCGSSGSSSAGTSTSSRGVRGASLAVRAEDLPVPAWGDRLPVPAAGRHAGKQEGEEEQEEEEEEAGWSDDDQIPEVQRYLKSLGQAAAQRQWRHSSDGSDVE